MEPGRGGGTAGSVAGTDRGWNVTTLPLLASDLAPARPGPEPATHDLGRIEKATPERVTGTANQNCRLTHAWRAGQTRRSRDEDDPYTDDEGQRLPRRERHPRRRGRAAPGGGGHAVIRVTLTTICGTDLHILRGEYPVKPGLIIGHEPVGVIDELGDGVTGYKVGDRVLVGAITPCGQCLACLSGHPSQCGHGEGYEAVGGWRFGNTINGAQAEYLLVPYAQANLAKIPDDLTRRAGRAAGRHRVHRILRGRIGRHPHRRRVVVFAQGPIGLCATAGAKLMGASLVIGVDADAERLAMARRMGADVTLDYRDVDVVAEVMR